MTAVAALLLGGGAASPAEESWTPVRAFRQFSKAQWRGLPQSHGARPRPRGARVRAIRAQERLRYVASATA